MDKIFYYLFVLLLISSCKNNSEDVIMSPVNSAWNKATEQFLEFEIKDNQNPKNIIFVVRNNEDYPYNNLRLIVKLSNKKGENKHVDTLNYLLAKPNGEWIGTGWGSTKEILFQYKMNYTFPEKGMYKIGIKQAMRNDILKGIEDIGVKIESAKP